MRWSRAKWCPTRTSSPWCARPSKPAAVTSRSLAGSLPPVAGRRHRGVARRGRRGRAEPAPTGSRAACQRSRRTSPNCSNSSAPGCRPPAGSARPAQPPQRPRRRPRRTVPVAPGAPVAPIPVYSAVPWNARPRRRRPAKPLRCCCPASVTWWSWSVSGRTRSTRPWPCRMAAGGADVRTAGKLSAYGHLHVDGRQSATAARAHAVLTDQTVLVAFGLGKARDTVARLQSVAAISADQIWVVVDAGRKQEDTARWVKVLASQLNVTAVAVVGAAETATPETVRAAGTARGLGRLRRRPGRRDIEVRGSRADPRAWIRPQCHPAKGRLRGCWYSHASRANRS